MKADRKDVINALEEIARLLELQGANPFKIRAYTNGARTLNSLDEEFATVVAEERLGDLKGFGDALVQKITELVETGSLEYLENLRAEFPPGLLDLLKLGGVGPKKVKLFYDELQVTSIDDLEAACADGRVAKLPGCGEKTAQKILVSIERFRASESQFLFPAARQAAEMVVASLQDLAGLERLEIAGSLRRYKEVTKDADLLGATSTPQPIMDAFVELPYVQEVLAHGSTKSSVILDNGMQVDLRLVEPAVFASALHHFTGSKEHNVEMRGRAIRRGLKLSEWGLFRIAEGEADELIPCQDEAALFDHLGLCFIPPELREGLGEIDAAEHDELPTLVSLSDYRGLLHCHTHASDGANSLRELADHARQLGHDYLGITDHSKSSFQANGLDSERLLAQVAEVRTLNESLDDLTLFPGVECDILPDGQLDYPDEVLAELDFFIVSVHSAFSRSEEEQTARVIKALEHPGSRILAHPTGRLLLRRDSYAIKLEKVIDAAIANGVAIEFNCHPARLDMEWRQWRRAIEKGAICSLNADAHSLHNFALTEDGIGFCRKGWMGPEQILNCWSTERVRAFFGHGS